ncbi:MAG TPA: ribonuclease III [Desulfurivibrio alkaliphilus]|uniref:Ribonuclease 3 n=1 Tax=Desulfurivibrio alkaliphilus TaxID=427923 RepID=A0A7C2XH13_9BACT|nr:ribonuclease III [Desulfurivibrio alkaliphilus]
MQEAVATLERCLAYRFGRPELLARALVHSSWAAEQGEPEENNERLEFLGDAVVDLAVAALLYEYYPAMREGDLSRRRAALVNESHLALLAGEIGLAPLLLLGRGEERGGGRGKPSILAAAFEAVIGAVYLDGGYPAAHALLGRLFAPWVADPPPLGQSDSKSALQEILQERYGATPEYRLEGEEGPAHERRFTVAVIFRGQVLGRGVAGRKKEAERRAAVQALAGLEKKDGSVLARGDLLC